MLLILEEEAGEKAEEYQC